MARCLIKYRRTSLQNLVLANRFYGLNECEYGVKRWANTYQEGDTDEAQEIWKKRAVSGSLLCFHHTPAGFHGDQCPFKWAVGRVHGRPCFSSGSRVGTELPSTGTRAYWSHSYRVVLQGDAHRALFRDGISRTVQCAGPLSIYIRYICREPGQFSQYSD
jgi:hypothetical protein